MTAHENGTPHDHGHDHGTVAPPETYQHVGEGVPNVYTEPEPIPIDVQAVVRGVVDSTARTVAREIHDKAMAEQEAAGLRVRCGQYRQERDQLQRRVDFLEAALAEQEKVKA